MRKSRPLTSAERWELGLFLSLIIVACLCVTAILNLQSLPRLFAFTSKNIDAPAAPPVTPQIIPPTARIPASAMATPSFNNTMAAPVLPDIETTDVPEVPSLPKATRKHAPEIKYFNGHVYQFVRTLRLRVTAYSPDSRCCWPYPGTTTASGLSVKTNHGRLVAADTRLIPMHALVSVPGYANGAAVPVLDRGGAIKGHRLDVLMPNFDAATDWGSRMIDVKVYMPVDE